MATPPSPVKLSKSRMVSGYLAIGLLLAMFAAFLASLPWTGSDSNPDEDAILMRIRPLADIALEPLPASKFSGQQTGKSMFQEFCQSCHGKGLGGAPGSGDRKAWTPRMDQGLDALVQSVTAGKCNMPPGSGPAADQMALARAVVYMIWPSMRL
ncbi:MAG: c-type cytochrome [Pseudomonadota bacterium]